MTQITLKIKYGNPKTHQIGPEKWLRSMQRGVPLEGQNDHQTSQGERGSSPSDLEAQNSVLATENPLDFSG